MWKKMNLVNLPKLVNLSNWVEFNFQFIEYLVKLIQYTPLNSCKPYIYRITEFVELLNFATTLNYSTDKNGEKLWRVRGRLQRLGREAPWRWGISINSLLFHTRPPGSARAGKDSFNMPLDLKCVHVFIKEYLGLSKPLNGIFSRNLSCCLFARQTNSLVNLLSGTKCGIGKKLLTRASRLVTVGCFAADPTRGIKSEILPCYSKNYLNIRGVARIPECCANPRLTPSCLYQANCENYRKRVLLLK